MTKRGPRQTLYCSFCGKAEHEVIRLIKGPTVFICDECVRLCVDLIEMEKADDDAKLLGLTVDERARLIIFGSDAPSAQTPAGAARGDRGG